MIISKQIKKSKINTRLNSTLNFWIFIFSVFISSCNSQNTYFIRLNNTYGLKDGDPVSIKGKDIGKVESLDLVNGKILAKIAISRHYPLYKYSKAVVKDISILGNKTIEIILPSNLNKPLQNNDTIPEAYQVDNKLNPLIKKADSIVNLFKDTNPVKNNKN